MEQENILKIEISPEVKILGEIDLDKFVELMTANKFKGFQSSIFHSTTIIKNETKWTKAYLANVLSAEMDWGAILTSLEWREKGAKLIFRVCPIKYENIIEYQKFERSQNFDSVTLKEKHSTGTDLMVINSFNPNPEHNIDIWLSKVIFPYPNSEWEKITFDEEKGEDL